jgi:hypothetical protein
MMSARMMIAGVLYFKCEDAVVNILEVIRY